MCLWEGEEMSDINQEGSKNTPQRPDEQDGGRILLTAVARAVVLLLERMEPRGHPLNIQALQDAIVEFGEVAK